MEYDLDEIKLKLSRGESLIIPEIKSLIRELEAARERIKILEENLLAMMGIHGERCTALERGGFCEALKEAREALQSPKEPK